MQSIYVIKYHHIRYCIEKGKQQTNMNLTLGLFSLSLLTIKSSDAFSHLHNHGYKTITTITQQQPKYGSLLTTTSRSTKLSMSTGNEEVERLRAAAAKAREDVERLSKELGKTSSTVIEMQKKQQKATVVFDDNVKAMFPVSETDLSKQMSIWEELKTKNMISKFGIANLRTYPVSLQMLQSRTGVNAESIFNDGTDVNLDDFKYATLYVTGFSTVAAIGSLAFLPENIGATLCYFFAVIPILFLGIGSTSPVIIANAIAGIRNSIGSKDDKENNQISISERRCRHEAAHFCCGYWCGLPIRTFTADEKTGVYQVDFAISSASGGYSTTEIAALTITGLSGLVGEILQYNNAIGATEDLLTLDMIYRRSKEFIGSAAQQDLTRWGVLTAVLLLKQYNTKYEQIVKAFQQQKSIEECIAILEEN